MTEKIFCEKCGQELAIIKSDKEIQLTDKGMMAILGVTIEGKISGSLYCRNCGHTRIYNPPDLPHTPIIFQANETFYSNRQVKLEDA